VRSSSTTPCGRSFRKVTALLPTLGSKPPQSVSKLCDAKQASWLLNLVQPVRSQDIVPQRRDSSPRPYSAGNGNELSQATQSWSQCSHIPLRLSRLGMISTCTLTDPRHSQIETVSLCWMGLGPVGTVARFGEPEGSWKLLALQTVGPDASRHTLMYRLLGEDRSYSALCSCVYSARGWKPPRSTSTIRPEISRRFDTARGYADSRQRGAGQGRFSP